MKPSHDPRAKLKPMVLTERDHAVFEKILAYRVLTTEQLQALCFSSAHRARKRLRALWLHGFLSRHVRPVRIGLGTSQMAYSLTKRGLAQVTTKADSSPSVGVRRPILSDHGLHITGFRVALESGVKCVPNLSMGIWRQDKDLKMTAEIQSNTVRKPVTVVPDALFCLKYDDKDYCYCLEIDRGTTDLGRIMTKLQAYTRIWQDGTIKAKFGYRSFRLLFVTTSNARLKRILDRLAAPIHRNRRIDVLNLTTFDDYSLKQPEKVFETIWRTVGPTAVPTFVSPFPAIPNSTFPTAPGKPPVRGPDA